MPLLRCSRCGEPAKRRPSSLSSSTAPDACRGVGPCILPLSLCPRSSLFHISAQLQLRAPLTSPCAVPRRQPAIKIGGQRENAGTGFSSSGYSPRISSAGAFFVARFSFFFHTRFFDQLQHHALYSLSQQRSAGHPASPTTRHHRVGRRHQREAHRRAHQVW